MALGHVPQPRGASERAAALVSENGRTAALLAGDVHEERFDEELVARTVEDLGAPASWS